MFTTRILWIAALLIVSCTDKTKTYTANEIASTLVGEWQTDEMFMKFISYRDTGRDSVLMLKRGTYSQVMGTTSQVIRFDSNGNYMSYSLKLTSGDTIKSLGNWQTSANKLIIDYTLVRNEYNITHLDSDSIVLNGTIDLDGDEVIDDQVSLTIIRR